jgi:sugar/nucleoside kinase (ribokinase family)
MTNIDFLAIGDIVTEPFIKITDAETTCDLNKEHCKLSFRFGDKIPYESAEVCKAVGNSPNAAVCAARLGLNTCLVSYIGEDSVGKENIEELLNNKINIDYMETVPGMKSNYHFVLWYDTERTILVNHNEYPYSFPSDLPEPKWIYLSSLAQNSTEYHVQIVEYLKIHPDVKLAFSPGTFQMKLGYEALKDVYERTEVFLCNKQEAQRVLKNDKIENELDLLKMLHSLGPKIVVVTDGLNGAYASNGEEAWFVPIYPKDPYERTGAGDAFCSTFVSCQILEKSIPESLLRSGINAMSVVQQVGPQKGLLTIDQIEEVLAEAPENYKVTKIK